MLVFKVVVEETLHGYEVRCPDEPGVRYAAPSLWDACGARSAVAEHAGVPDDLVWLHIRSRVGGITVTSDVHPLHWVAFHSMSCPSSPAPGDSSLMFEQALTALRHEADHATAQDRAHARVKLMLAFGDGMRVCLPRSGGYHLTEVVGETSATEDLSGWVRTRLIGVPAAETDWSTPVVALQIGVFNPDAASGRRYR